MKKNTNTISTILIVVIMAVFLAIFSIDDSNYAYVRYGNLLFVLPYLFIVYRIDGKKRNLIFGITFCIFFLYLIFLIPGLISYNHSKIFYAVLTIAISGFVSLRKSNEKCQIYIIIGALLLSFNFWAFALLDVYHTYDLLTTILLACVLYYWTYSMVNASLFLIDKICVFINSERVVTKNRKGLTIDWICFLIFLLVGIILSVIYYPGIITPDNVSLYNTAHHFDDISLRTDISSFLYQLIVYGLLNVVDNYYILTITMIVLFALVWKRMIRIFFEYGASNRALIGLTIIWLSFPRNLWMYIATWKDIPFTICMFAFFVENTKWILGSTDDLDKGDYIVTALSLFGISSFRSNGMFVIICIGICYLILLLKKVINRKIMYSVVSAIVMLLILKGPIFSLMHVSFGESGFAALPFLDGIWENIAQDNELSEKTINTIEEIAPYEEFKANYKADYVYYWWFPNGYMGLNTKAIVNAYFESLRKYPIDTLIGRFKKTYSIWAVFPHKDYPLDHNYEIRVRDFAEDGGNPEWHYIEAFEPIRRFFQNQYIGGDTLREAYYALDRCGVCIVIWMLLYLYAVFKRKKKVMILTLPMIFNTIILLICCCYNDCCYTYPMTAITLQFIFVFFLYNKKLNREVVTAN